MRENGSRWWVSEVEGRKKRKQKEQVESGRREIKEGVVKGWED